MDKLGEDRGKEKIKMKGKEQKVEAKIRLETANPSNTLMLESRWMTPYQWKLVPLCIPNLGLCALQLKAESVW